MKLMIAALLVLVLVVGAVCWQLMVLEREIRRQGGKADHRHAELEGRIQALNAWSRVLESAVNENEDQRKKDVDALLAENVQMEKALRGVWEALKPLPEMAEGVQALLARESVSDALGRLEKRLADAPGVLSQDDESRLSREMQEGIENVLGYSLAQAREGKT